MSNVAKTVELSAESPESFEDAVKVGIAKAAETLRGIQGAYVKEQKVVVTDQAVTAYRVHMQVTFAID